VIPDPSQRSMPELAELLRQNPAAFDAEATADVNHANYVMGLPLAAHVAAKVAAELHFAHGLPCQFEFTLTSTLLPGAPPVAAIFYPDRTSMGRWLFLLAGDRWHCSRYVYPPPPDPDADPEDVPGDAAGEPGVYVKHTWMQSLTIDTPSDDVVRHILTWVTTTDTAYDPVLPHRTVDVEGIGWCASHPGDRDDYPTYHPWFGGARDLTPMPYLALTAVRGPLRPVAPPDPVRLNIFAGGLHMAGNRAVVTLAVAAWRAAKYLRQEGVPAPSTPLLSANEADPAAKAFTRLMLWGKSLDEHPSNAAGGSQRIDRDQAEAIAGMLTALCVLLDVAYDIPAFVALAFQRAADYHATHERTTPLAPPVVWRAMADQYLQPGTATGEHAQERAREFYDYLLTGSDHHKPSIWDTGKAR